MPENPPAPWEYCLYLPDDLRAVTVSRRTLRLILTVHGLISLGDTAELLATELVSNAVRHAKGPAALRVGWTAGVLRLGAWDADPQPPGAAKAVGGTRRRGGRPRPRTGSGLRRPVGLAAAVPERQAGEARVVRARCGLRGLRS